MNRFVWLPVILAFAASAASSREGLTLHRTFKPAEADSYQMSMTEHLESADAEVESTWTETVSAVDKDGGADVKEVNSSFHITANGMDIPAPPPNSKSFHFLGDGVFEGPVTDETSVSHVLPDLFAAYAMDKPLVIGLEVNVDGKNGPNLKATGTVKLLEVKDGMAKVMLKLLFAAPNEPKSLRADATAIFQVGSARLESIEGTISDLPAKMAGRYNVQSADFKVKRLP